MPIYRQSKHLTECNCGFYHLYNGLNKDGVVVLDKIKVGNRIEFYRRKMGLSQAKVAELGEMGDKTFTNAERGKCAMDLETLMKICDVLEVTPNDLLLYDDEPLSEMQKRVLDSLTQLDEDRQKMLLDMVEHYVKLELAAADNK